MKMIDIFAENASLMGSNKPGRRAKRGNDLERDDPDNPTTYPSAVINTLVKIPEYRGMGLITGNLNN